MLGPRSLHSAKRAEGSGGCRPGKCQYDKGEPGPNWLGSSGPQDPIQVPPTGTRVGGAGLGPAPVGHQQLVSF